MQEQMNNLIRDMEILRKNQKELLEIKNSNKLRMSLTGSLVHCTLVRKESLTLRKYQQIPQKMKYKVEKTEKTSQNSLCNNCGSKKV